MIRAAPVLGLWTCMALVMGNMIGSGVYLLPAALASYGWNAVFGWLVTICGALALAAVFARLAQASPLEGGPYAYAGAAFGPGMGFAVAWSYWLSVVVGNAAIAAGSVSYLAALWPAMARVPGLAALLTVGAVWVCTALNCAGAGTAGRVQALVTLTKLMPLLAVLGVAAWVLARGGVAHPISLHGRDIHPAAINGAATLTLWGLLGLESATVPAGRVADPARTIPLATLIGTGLTGALYLAVCSAVLLMVPGAELAASPAPLADFLRRYWGADAGAALAGFAALSGLGALLGWTLLQGELACGMARRGAFPAWLGATTAHGTPLRAHVVSCAIVSVTVLLNEQRSVIDLFTFVVLLSTDGSLFAYLATALAALWLQRQGELKRSCGFTVVAVLAGLFSAWTIYGAGPDASVWGGVGLLAALPIYRLMRARGKQSFFEKKDQKTFDY